MRKLTGQDLRELGLLKHYRVVRRWACKNNDLTSSDIELLIQFDCIGEFKRTDFEEGTLTYSWDNRRWNKLVKNGWVKIWRKANNGDKQYSLYKISHKANCLIQQMYRIMLGEEDIPMSVRRNKVMKRESYSDKLDGGAMKLVNNDKTR